MEQTQLFGLFFIIFFILKHSAQFYLSWRNKNHVAKNRAAVPAKFTDSISLEEHQKAADYTIAKSNFGRWNLLFDAAVLLVWIKGGGLELLDQLVRSLELSQLWTGVLFLLGMGLVSSILGIPWEIYNTFVLEEKFGFNKTTPKTFITDFLKQLVLGLIIGIPLILALLWIMQSLGENWWIYAWLFLTGFQFIMIWAYPKFIAPLFNKFSKLDNEELAEKVNALLARCDFQSSGFYVMNASMRSSHGNAYFTGFGKNKRIVFFDTLIKALTPSEVEAVLAHELGHYRLKHIVKGMVRSIFFSLIGFFILGALTENMAFYQGHNVSQASNYMALALFSMVLPLYTFFITPLSSWFSRKYEFEADQFAADKSNARNLITALVKLYRDNASTLTPDPIFTAFYHSHPPALERIEHLEGLSR